MKELLLLLLVDAASVAAVVQLPPPEAWERANAATKRIQPAGFTGIPQWLTTELTRRHCSIPQSFGANRPHNIIRGFFNDGKVSDWAALSHSGIDDAFVGKGSVVWYWRGGKWLRLTGAD